MSPTHNWVKRAPGETLVEVMVAVSMLALVVTPATNMYVTSLRTTAQNRANLIASTLAEEGIEMMRNIRDTNILRFPQKKSLCWDTIPTYTNQSDCENYKIGDGSHVLLLDLSTLQWGLAQQNAVALSPNLGDSSDVNYQLYLDDVPGTPCASPGNPPNCHTHFTDDTHVYSANNAVYPSAQSGPRGVPTEFYREIFVQHVDLDGNNANGPEVMEITSRVSYRVGAAVRAVVRRDLLERPF